jgi:hypothetical protein
MASENTVAIYVCDYRRGRDWWMDLLTTYTHRPELQVITVPSLISTLYKSPRHSLSLFLTCCVFISRSLATSSNSGDCSVSRTQVLFSQPPVQNSNVNWRLKIRLAAISHQTPNLLFTGWPSINWVFIITTLYGPIRKHRPFVFSSSV